jgi:hypothetical protein
MESFKPKGSNLFDAIHNVYGAIGRRWNNDPEQLRRDETWKRAEAQLKDFLSSNGQQEDTAKLEYLPYEDSFSAFEDEGAQPIQPERFNNNPSEDAVNAMMLERLRELGISAEDLGQMKGLYLPSEEEERKRDLRIRAIEDNL